MASSALLRQLLTQAASSASALLERCLDDAIAALQEFENKSATSEERQERSEAWRQLLKFKPGWTAEYPRELSVAFQAAPSAQASPGAAPRSRQPLDSLTLVDEDQLLQTIEASRLAQLLAPMVEQPLAELDGLVSSLLGLDAVRPEQNPLRPDNFAQALRKLMGAAGAPPALSSLWLRHLGKPLGNELNQLYRTLTQQLKAANVEAAAYRVLPAASSSAPAGASPGQPAEPAPGRHGVPAGMPALAQAGLGDGSAWADLSAVQVGDELVQDFLWRAGAQHQAPLAPAYYARVEEEIAALLAAQDAGPAYDPALAEQARHLPVVSRPQRAVDVDSPLPGTLWGDYAAPRQRSLVRSQLKKRAGHVGQVLGLEVVRKLVNQVAQDPRLLAPVRESIVALEPTLLRLAMLDPRFFGKETHPARRLVERVAERSFKYNDEFGEDFQAFAHSVAQVFNELNHQELEDTAPVEQALAAMEATWSAQDEEEARQREQVLEAVRFAEQRQAEADQIARELGQRPDLEGVAAAVQDFVFGLWALVMANARLRGGKRHIDPGGYGAVVSDLLWSAKSELTLRDPARAFELIPGLLVRLRHGLDSLGQDARECETFFRVLEKLHWPVLKLRARQRRDSHHSVSPAPEVDPTALAPAARRQPQPTEALWMGADELEAAGFQDTLPIDDSEPASPQEEPSRAISNVQEPIPASADSAQIDAGTVIAGLREGCWVDLFSRKRWLRARLVWAGAKGNLFMFTSRGGQPHSMTRRSLERLVRERLLRPVDMQGVVEQALDTLSANARQPGAGHSRSRPQSLAA